MAMSFHEDKMNYPELERAIKTIEQLRHPKDGCPWDLEQTHETLLKYLIEESYEFIDAVENKSAKQMEEEIGDVLLQVLLHSTIASESKKFTLETVAKTLSDKMVRRHPHVFSNGKAKNPEEVVTEWNKIKAQEKNETSKMPKKLLNQTALKSSYDIGVASSKINFDWKNYSEVLEKVEEEFEELKEELKQTKNRSEEKISEELGDLFFSLAQLARHLNLNPEEVARNANKKFLTRFHKMEELIKTDINEIINLDSSEMESYWIKSKNILKK
jgi:MazG family protein